MWNKIQFTFTSLLLAAAAKASYRGAEIRYAPVASTLFTYSITVDIYRTVGPGDNDEITLDYGDGINGMVPRVQFQDLDPQDNCGSVRLSTYQTEHTFPGPGSYSIRFNGASRGGGILNIPNSVSQGVCVEARLIINPVLGTNSSIAFDSLQIAWQQNWNTWSHAPTPVEADGDSLSFELVTPWGQSCALIAGYNPIVGTNSIWLDPQTGAFLWDYPPFSGTYALAIRGSEWRNGQLIGQVTRDIHVCIAGFIAGIGEQNGGAVVSLWPCISADLVNLQNGTNAPLMLNVFATNGSLVETASIFPGSSILSIANLSPGIYSANFSDAQGILVRSVRLVRP